MYGHAVSVSQCYLTILCPALSSDDWLQVRGGLPTCVYYFQDDKWAKICQKISGITFTCLKMNDNVFSIGENDSSQKLLANFTDINAKNCSYLYFQLHRTIISSPKPRDLTPYNDMWVKSIFWIYILSNRTILDKT